MKDVQVNILGTDYTIKHRDELSDESLIRLNRAGYTDFSDKTIVISNMQKSYDSYNDQNWYNNNVTRHEIVHAFLFESGLDNEWARNEQIVDWIALQIPQMAKVMKEAGVLTEEETKSEETKHNIETKYNVYEPTEFTSMNSQENANAKEPPHALAELFEKREAIKIKEIEEEAIELFGDKQIVVAIEELSELQKCLTKYLRGSYQEYNIAEEMADVKIMLEQLELKFKNSENVDKIKKIKIEKLEKMVTEAKENGVS